MVAAIRRGYRRRMFWAGVVLMLVAAPGAAFAYLCASGLRPTPESTVKGPWGLAVLLLAVGLGSVIGRKCYDPNQSNPEVRRRIGQSLTLNASAPAD